MLHWTDQKPFVCHQIRQSQRSGQTSNGKVIDVISKHISRYICTCRYITCWILMTLQTQYLHVFIDMTLIGRRLFKVFLFMRFVHSCRESILMFLLLLSKRKSDLSFQYFPSEGWKKICKKLLLTLRTYLLLNEIGIYLHLRLPEVSYSCLWLP